MKQLLVWVAVCCLSGVSQASVKLNLLGAESHGGNPNLRSLFREAKLQAAAILEQIDPKDFREGRDPRFADFVVEKRYDWALDVLNSPHYWPADDKEEQENLKKLPQHLRDRSAYTTLEPKAKVIFSYTVCDAHTRTLERAVQVLLHESLHHLKIADEEQIDLIVDSVTTYWDKHRSADEKLMSSTVGGLPSDIFPHDALKICSTMPFTNDKAQCLRTIRFARFDSAALEYCASASSGPNQNTCLIAIKNRVFESGAVDMCIARTFSESVTCLRTVGVESESLYNMGEKFEASPWFVLSAHNYDLLTDATSNVRAQAKLVCEGWKQAEYKKSDWEQSECVRTKVPVGPKTKTVAEKSDYFYHCSVRARCTMRLP